MLPARLKNYRILLASGSARRQQLLQDTGIEFQLADTREIDERYPEGLTRFEIPVYLAGRKSDAYFDLLEDKGMILITADTIVWLDGKVLGKPATGEEAFTILKALSGNIHEVITGVTLRTINKKRSFYSNSEVCFSRLKEEEIQYYIENYKPFDKAGAYGIQEWIGYIGIESIRGSFYNVMGLPVHKLYRELEEFIDTE